MERVRDVVERTDGINKEGVAMSEIDGLGHVSDLETVALEKARDFYGWILGLGAIKQVATLLKKGD